MDNSSNQAIVINALTGSHEHGAAHHLEDCCLLV
jgi:hypothetical protein